MKYSKKNKYNFGVIYNVAHDGFLMKAFAHRYQNHLNERAVFLLNKNFDGVTDSKAFDKTRFVYKDMHEFSKDEENFLEDRIVRRMESFFQANTVSIAKYKEVYSFVDEVDLVGIYCESKGIKYHSIEVVPNLFHRQSKFRSFDLETISTNATITRSPGYDNIIIKHGLRYGGGKMCKQQVFLNNTHKLPDSVKDIESVSYWDYKGILSAISKEYMNSVMKFYKLSSDVLDGKQDVSLVVFSSQNMFSHHKKTEGILDKKNFDREFMLAYQLIADFFSQQHSDICFKPHPRESKFDFSPYFNEKSLIPPLFPTEIIQYIEGFEVKELLSTTSSAGDYFTDDKRPDSLTLGTSYYAIYNSLVKLFVVMVLCRYFSIDIINLYTSDLPQNMVDVFLKKNGNNHGVNLLRLFKDVEANDDIFILANSMTDRDKSKLKKLIKNKSKRLTVVFFKPEEFNDILKQTELLKKIKEVTIKKTTLNDDRASIDLEDEIIYIFESGTSNFEEINEFTFDKNLVYTGVNLSATCKDKVKVVNMNLKTNFKSQTVNKSGSDNKKDGAINSKYREIGKPLKRNVNYDIKIENGSLHIVLSEIPPNICVGFELLLNMNVVDTLTPSHVIKASFELRNFGSYSVRLRFYESSDLNDTAYRYDTKPFDYTMFSAIGALNPKALDCKNALDRFERLLFNESYYKDQQANLLSTLVQQLSISYSFVDELVSKGITSLYFYCEEDEWGFGHAVFSLLYNDRRIKIKNCISNRPFVGDNIGGIYRKVKFVNRNSCYYDEGESVFLATVLPEPDLVNKLRKSGLNVHSLTDFEDVFQKGLFINPYIEFKLKNPNVDIVFIKRPLHISKMDFDSRSENENEIVTAKMTMHELQNQLKQNPPIIPLALEECRASLEDVVEFAAFSQQMTSDFGVHGRPVERRGELVNIVDGYRVTTDQPPQFKNTIYFYGSSMIYSPFTADESTAASFLQRMINDSCKNCYRVINCGGWTNLTQSNMLENMIFDHEYIDGDIIIVMPERSIPSRGGFTLIDLEHIFTRPHDHGEIWVGVQSNVNEIGQKLIAEGVFNGLKENGLI